MRRPMASVTWSSTRNARRSSRQPTVRRRASPSRARRARAPSGRGSTGEQFGGLDRRVRAEGPCRAHDHDGKHGGRPARARIGGHTMRCGGGRWTCTEKDLGFLLAVTPAAPGWRRTGTGRCGERRSGIGPNGAPIRLSNARCPRCASARSAACVSRVDLRSQRCRWVRFEGRASARRRARGGVRGRRSRGWRRWRR